MKFKLKEKKAPAWFRKYSEEMESNKKECANILGVGTHWLEDKNRQPMKTSELIKDFNISKDDADRFKFLVKIYNAIGDLMWAKFRLKNIGTEWGKEGIIKYDPKKNNLILYASPLSVIMDTFKKTFNQYAKTIKDK